jgi:hypothetical protein
MCYSGDILRTARKVTHLTNVWVCKGAAWCTLQCPPSLIFRYLTCACFRGSTSPSPSRSAHRVVLVLAWDWQYYSHWIGGESLLVAMKHLQTVLDTDLLSQTHSQFNNHFRSALQTTEQYRTEKPYAGASTTMIRIPTNMTDLFCWGILVRVSKIGIKKWVVGIPFWGDMDQEQNKIELVKSILVGNIWTLLRRASD